ncbi:MAG TPA: DNA polymerase III subunit beta [Tissierellia bacterium]|jgi:DNA polymerase-3 subunit beta|nr:DNA polymerase III subunit beta [Tissierellia bacterium]
MKFTVNQREMLYALNILSKAVSSRTTLEALKGVYIEAFDDHLHMKTNDLSLSIQIETPALVEEKGHVLIDFQLFNELIRKLPDDALTLSKNEDTLSLICGHASYRLLMMDSSYFPQIPLVEGGQEIRMNQGMFSNLIKMTNFAISTDETRPILTGSLMEIEGDEMKMISIDGYSIAIKKVPIISGENIHVVVPGKTLREVQRIIAYNVDDEILLQVTDNYISFSFDNVLIISKILQGEYVNYKQVISDDFAIHVEMDHREFFSAIDRAAIMANQSKNYLVVCQFEDDTLKITSSAQTGQAKEEVEIKKQGDDIRIGLNPNYLLKALRTMESEHVTMSLTTSQRPCRISPTDDDSFTFYLVPIRINQ